MSTKHIIIGLLAILVFQNISNAQIEVDLSPHSFGRMANDNEVNLVTMTLIDVQKLVNEDERDKELGLPWRFGKDLEVNLNPSNAGTWTNLNDGGRIWRLKIHSPNAYSINLIYSDFYIPEGATFHIYNKANSQVIGAFTSKNNRPNGKFATGIVKGDICTLEYYEPKSEEGKGIINISKVIHAYKDIFSKAVNSFGSSGSCNNNINCPEGNDWQDEKRSVAMILTSNNSRICTGALINNAQQNSIPYFLTANHCFSSIGDTENWIFMFNYESANCTNTDGSINQTISGCSVKARNSDSDFLLVRLSSKPPESYNVYLAGWSRENINSSSSVGIHHPRGDVKKISFDSDASSSSSYEPFPYLSNSHWKISNWDDGTTEGGSSGSPLFDQNSRIVGQLHGGFASCSSNTADFYGKFSMSWDRGSSSSNRLKEWLDPNNTGLTTLNGINACYDVVVSNVIYNSNTTIDKCNVELNNVSITNGASVDIRASKNLIINGSFDAQLGTTLNIDNQ